MQRYLLGELPEAERAALEQEYFNDRGLFDQVVRAENELVDRYARGLLPPPARERFERYYLAHPERRERAKFAEALVARLDQAGEASAAPAARAESSWGRWLASMRGPKLTWAFSAALLLLAAGATWYFIQTRRPQQELAKTESPSATEERRGSEAQVENERQPSDLTTGEQERPRVEQQNLPPSPTPPVKATPAVASLVLTVGGTRSADAAPPAVLVIPAGTERVRLRLNLMESDYPSYRAALQAAGGREIYAWRRLAPQATKSGASLSLTIPARRFAAGDYILTLRGVGETGEVEDVSKSLFRVERQ